MSENQPEPTHQDPAEPNEVGTEVETNDQPEPSPEDTSDSDDPAAPVAVDPEPVEVAPAEAPGLLEQFEVTPERGYRKKD